MDLKTKLKGLLAVGIGNLFQSAAYAWKRDRVDGKFLPPAEPGPERLPGGIHSFSALGGGLTVNFENAQLEVRFLAPDFVRVTWTPGELPYPYTIARTQWPVVKTDYAPWGGIDAQGNIVIGFSRQVRVTQDTVNGGKKADDVAIIPMDYFTDL